KRLKACLQDAWQTLGDREAVVAREITKVFEEVYRGRISAIIEALKVKSVDAELKVIYDAATIVPKC
ncbi:MAG: 16S rRNA (cytidine(1402)-2'-O)-methyltransferase, partial [Candidatus Methanomethylicia archaeon]